MSNADFPEAAADNHSEPTPGPQEIVTTPPLGSVATLVVCVVGFLVPGMGHILLKRWVRGAILAASVALMFIFGLGMNGKLYDLAEIQQPLQIFAFFADIGVGLLYWLAERSGQGIGDMTTRTFDYGTTFLWVAGLLNYLIVLDAYDIARGRKP